MNFMYMTPMFAGLFLAGAATIVGLLYWLKPPPRQLTIPSSLLWKRLLKEKRRSTLLDRLRWWLSLIIALAISLLMASAMGRPEFLWNGGDIFRMTIVIDNSTTMATRSADGFTRWDHALALGKELLKQGSVDGEFLIFDTSGQLSSRNPTDRRSALGLLDKLTVSLGSSSRFPDYASTDGLLYFISDGVMIDEVPDNAQVISVYSSVDNVGITAFEVAPDPSDPLAYQAFLEIANASLESKEISMRLSGAGESVFSDTLTLQAGELEGRTIDLSGFARGPIRLTVATESDAFTLDDKAFSFLPTRNLTQVTLVSPGSAYLQNALPDRQNLMINSMIPEEFDNDVKADLYIFDRWAPQDPPMGPALLFLPPNVEWLSPMEAVVTSPSISSWDQGHVLMDFVSLKDLRIDQAVRFYSEAGDFNIKTNPEDHTDDSGAISSIHKSEIIIGTPELPLMVASEDPHKMIRVAFSLEDSNFPLQPGFPIFLNNVLSWMIDDQHALPGSLGRIEVPVTEGEVTDLEGEEISSSQFFGNTVFMANEPGLYTVTLGSQRIRVAVNLTDYKRTTVNTSSFSPEDRAVVSPEIFSLTREEASGGELWFVFIWIATLMVIIEWFTYHLRWTV